MQRIPRARLSVAFLLASCFHPLVAAEFTGTVVDHDTGEPVAARVYVSDARGQWLFVESASPDGSALPYREQWVPTPGAAEKHTTISAHPFRVELEPGRYTITIERGKEYLPLTETVTLDDRPQDNVFRLKRWIDMASRGWYSGETHVHRRIEELPNVMLAEDLNVVFPVTFWTIDAFAAPGLEPSTLRRQGPSPFGPRDDRGPGIIRIDPTHVMFPRNTEYEIFSVGDKRHVLGAVFILNHESPFREGMPPVGPIAAQAHRQGALLDLDKHNWPWSMMLVPIAKVDLYELANNSVWRTRFSFRSSQTAPAPYMNVETDAGGMTEWGWLNFGFENYYALLDCGFRMQPTAGTASGVHPVPLGYSRVYVHVGDRFDAEAWIDGLRAGRSFVTTGPMLSVTLNERHPGHVFQQTEAQEQRYRLRGEAISARALDRIEIVVNGRIHQTFAPSDDRSQQRTSAPAHTTRFEAMIPVEESCWVVVRTFQFGPDRRVRFAHTAPWHIEVAGRPVRPRKQETDYLIGRIRDEIKRNENLLPTAAMEEYHEALRIYQRIAERAIPDID